MIKCPDGGRIRLMFYVQHLLGIGHLVRASRIVQALATDPFEVTVVIGGELPKGLGFGAASVVELPPVKAGPAGFAELVTPEGRAFGVAEQAARRELLLRHFDRLAPDVLLIEAFPFGRRQMRFELLPLLEAAVGRSRRPIVAASIRDILQENRKPGRDEETVALVEQFFDLVLVHGDRAIAQLDDSFPLAATIGDKLVYTGMVGPGSLPRADERFDVIVSVGGGAVGADLLHAAIGAKPQSLLRDARWLVLAGPNLPEGQWPGPAEGVVVRTFEPGLPALLRDATLSISQAGYNTVADLLAARSCRAVLVPFAMGGETEQSRRAAILAERSLAIVIEPDQASATSLARAIDRVLDLRPPETTFDLDGALHAKKVLEQAVLVRR